MQAQKSSGIIVNWIAEQILTEGTLKPRPLIGPIEQSRSHTNESQIGSYRKRIHLGPEIARAWKPSPIRDQNESSMTSKDRFFAGVVAACKGARGVFLRAGRAEAIIHAAAA
jgi:hypothetical protein